MALFPPMVTCPTCKGSKKGPPTGITLADGTKIEIACLDCGGSGMVEREIARALADPGVDFVARLAEAWDGRGRVAFTPPTEHEALCSLARIDLVCALLPWDRLTPSQRRRLVFGARRSIDMAKASAWCFGEGRGP